MVVTISQAHIIAVCISCEMLLLQRKECKFDPGVLIHILSSVCYLSEHYQVGHTEIIWQLNT